MLDYKQIIDKLDWEKNNGLIPVIVQGLDGDVLTLGYTDKEALSKTLQTGYVHYYSRSKERIRMKGETSGNYQKLKEAFVDCDNDTLLLKVDQTGPACHLGTKSCFRKIEQIDKLPESNIDYSLDFLNQLKEIIKERKKNPKEGSYTTYLFNEGKEKIYKKFGEEAVEVLVAPNRERTIYETADMIYHLLVLLTYEGIDIGEVVQELKKRHSPEGGKQS
ncbi:phosphoribosyl-ATP diphosphatase [Petrotoga mobilis SJ95]|jgi:phosphoribosyl-ATP pyrophosphohydrolase/phosphoribosyl-AMP cyclohydrolase|uniref:Histidine biosynthesis bifunctional protein HisIE n=1 Tax=Petrotoga mobilis (strain DSM 10674 / SJ95) TaxID=403833 RepID=A9BK00_PETMO|nr:MULTISPECIES: bifunctional phosphoribosyl-AMP cyclohydrolase/phosphoribosyl-ATP diphosphatase HisIE [Petrotoga]ABX31743.1 phosphoribosyl-ATP diphosphatase [Petrotoga mobilis SJ95]MBL5980764.1 phosphoribosyl-ATP pyrophosphatase [Petrotoga sp. 8T1HF07.NaAc.6.1]PNR88321.1 phosphoribosyl-ATP pyrophosphatase [Petrotoga sp. 9T1HF07.CasAA.8.2]PNR92069.1 phosphoribosyl-ATP pyrophosphatase [Petrotoga sp. HWHPT.55.6.3]RPD35642.1 phosphoribosyl-ATP pyrophosphatase [Petrotoga sp. HWH.PT.55.6.1]